MEIKKVTDAAFLKYGKIVSGIDFRSEERRVGKECL